MYLFPLFLSAATGTSPDQTVCRTNAYDETAVIKHVIDGDTVVLMDNRHVRLIGINTPEIAHDGRPAQPGAIQAQKYLGKLLPANTAVHLQYDRQRVDHYQRTLAHMFLKNGANIQALLLHSGLSTTLTIPPNLQFLDCYESVSTTAQSRRAGLWALTQYQPTPVELITTQDLGYRIITGQVTRVAKGQSATWVTVAKKLALRIDHENLQYFGNLQKLAGRHIRARGMLYSSNGQFRIHLRHPADMAFMTAPGAD